MMGHRYFFLVIIASQLIYITSVQATENDHSCNFRGEKLAYKMEYLGFHVANLNFSVSKREIDTTTVCQLSVTARSTDKSGKLFYVDNVYQIFFRSANFLPIVIEKYINQKNIQHDLKIRFDHHKSKAIVNDSTSYKIPYPCFDYFSMLYFIRSSPLNKGDTLNFYLDSEYLISRVEVVVESKEKEIKLACGQFRALQLKVKFDSITKGKRPWKTDLLTNRLAAPGSALTIWISLDKNRLPLMICYRHSLINTKIILNDFKLEEHED